MKRTFEEGDIVKHRISKESMIVIGTYNHTNVVKCRRYDVDNKAYIVSGFYCFELYVYEQENE